MKRTKTKWVAALDRRTIYEILNIQCITELVVRFLGLLCTQLEQCLFCFVFFVFCIDVFLLFCGGNNVSAVLSGPKEAKHTILAFSVVPTEAKRTHRDTDDLILQHPGQHRWGYADVRTCSNKFTGSIMAQLISATRYR